MMPTPMPCLSCRSISGEERISPGQIIYRSKHWMVEHAYPCAQLGWLVIVLNRHCTSLHELAPEEFAELASVLEKVVWVVHETTGSAKEYAMCLAEAPGFEHIHFHIVPRSADLASDLIGSKIFVCLKPEIMPPLLPSEIADYCTVAFNLLARRGNCPAVAD